MDWYWNLSGVLLKKQNVLNDGPSDGLRDILEADLIDLYQQLLLYQMKTALSCYGSQTLNFLKDLVKGNDWQGTLAGIQDAEQKFRENAQVYDTQKITASFEKSLELQENQSRKQFREDKKEILDWITKADYSARQSDHFEKRNKGTGLWLMQSDAFQSWLRESGKALFYHGIPGAGKTILTSVVVEELSTRYYTDNTVGIAYLYCEFSQQDTLRPVDLFLSILKQLTEGLHFIPAELEELHERRRNERPTFADVMKALRAIISQYSRVFVFVDALDECPVANGNRRDFLLSSLLPNLFRLQDECGINIFATSREIPEIMEAFDRNGSTNLPIRASDEDIRIFLSDQMKSLHPRVLDRPSLQEQIKNRIVDAAQGILSVGLEKLDETYDKALKRVDNQTSNDQTLAKRALSWVTFSSRPLSKEELDHAVAVEIGSSEFDDDNLSGVDYISSVCAGLVTVDASSNQIRLVHYTTYDYLKRTLPTWYSVGQKEIARNCVTYLSFDTFATGLCSKPDLEERLKTNELYEYAATNWGYHTRTSSVDGEDLVVNFLESQPKVVACIQAMELSGMAPRQSEDSPQEVIGLHLAAFHGLLHSIEVLLSRRPDIDLEAREDFDRTALIVAAENGHADVVQFLIEKGANLEAQDYDDRTALYAAAESGHEAVVKVLLEKGANKDGPEGPLYSPLGMAVENGHSAVAKLLLHNGANPEGTLDEYGKTALLSAVDMGDADMVRVLLNKGANPNAAHVDYGWTALTKATENGNEEIAKILLEHDSVDIDAYDDYAGATALFLAARYGREEIAKLLLEKGANWKAENEDGETLVDVAAQSGNEEMIKRLLEKHGKNSE
ncbi:hypothetical protein EIK77_005541 [Talaromyces pinophilus]|nr:hypothetical protein EIK77_005541 [Talaromyces pinophilus]